MTLKPCPCGQTPTKLSVVTESSGKPKWAHVSGDCCGEWHIEFRNDWKEIESEESHKRAAAAWNDAPRKENTP